jgi:hypothetical protein
MTRATEQRPVLGSGFDPLSTEKVIHRVSCFGQLGICVQTFVLLLFSQLLLSTTIETFSFEIRWVQLSCWLGVTAKRYIIFDSERQPVVPA